MDTDRKIEAFLDGGGYSSIEDWAADSDYILTDDGWTHEDGHPVDLEDCILGAMEACADWILVDPRDGVVDRYFSQEEARADLSEEMAVQGFAILHSPDPGPL